MGIHTDENPVSKESFNDLIDAKSEIAKMMNERKIKIVIEKFGDGESKVIVERDGIANAVIHHGFMGVITSKSLTFNKNKKIAARLRQLKQF